MPHVDCFLLQNKFTSYYQQTNTSYNLINIKNKNTFMDCEFSHTCIYKHSEKQERDILRFRSVQNWMRHDYSMSSENINEGEECFI